MDWHSIKRLFWNLSTSNRLYSESIFTEFFFETSRKTFMNFERRMTLLPPALASLRHPNFRLWFIGQSVSLIGTWMQVVAQQWIVYQLTGSTFLLGAITFANNVPTLVFMLPSGVLADRVSRKKILLVTQTAMMLCAFSVMALIGLQALKEWHLFLFAILLGIAGAVEGPARQAITVEMVEDRRDLMNAIALNASMFNAARVLGPVVAGWVLVQWGAAWCFGLNGLSFIAIIVGLLLMRFQPVSQAHMGQPLQETKDGLWYVWRHAIIMPLMVLTGISAFFGFTYSALLPAIAVDVLRIGGDGYGFLNAAVGIGALFGSLIVASWTHEQWRGKILFWGSMLFPGALILFAMSRNYPLSLALLVLVGAGFVSQAASINTLIQSIVTDELRGRVMAVYMFVFFGALTFGALQIGAFAQYFGSAEAVALNAIICLLGTIALYATRPALRALY
jgi:MFS family permease